MPLKLTTHNVGSVNSIGNAVFLAGSPRYACANSNFMFHGVGFNIQQTRLEEKLLRERLSTILSDQARIGFIIKERTQLDTKEIEGLFGEAKTMDATQAASKGIIDEIREVQIPEGATIQSLVFKR